MEVFTYTNIWLLNRNIFDHLMEGITSERFDQQQTLSTNVIKDETAALTSLSRFKMS